jgi:DNA-binding transcriptional ArsR family regulator
MAYEQSLTALCDPTRRGIFESLVAGPMAVGQLAKGLPVSRAAVSQHLKVLWVAGLVRQHREGRLCLYEIDPSGLKPIRAWLDRLWDGALRKFSEHAEYEGCPSRDSPPQVCGSDEPNT